jgi:hypothetical protein
MDLGQSGHPKTLETRYKICKIFLKNLLFRKQFLLNRMKKIFFDLKSWGPLKNVKTRSGSYLALGLSINVKKRNENLAGLSL